MAALTQRTAMIPAHDYQHPPEVFAPICKKRKTGAILNMDATSHKFKKRQFNVWGGCLCAFCGKDLKPSKFTIEHVKPACLLTNKTKCNSMNFVACCHHCNSDMRNQLGSAAIARKKLRRAAETGNVLPENERNGLAKQIENARKHPKILAVRKIRFDIPLFF